MRIACSSLRRRRQPLRDCRIGVQHVCRVDGRASRVQRLDDLPVQFHGRRGHYQFEQARSLAARLGNPTFRDGDSPAYSPASAEHRSAQRAAFIGAGFAGRRAAGGAASKDHLRLVDDADIGAGGEAGSCAHQAVDIEHPRQAQHIKWWCHSRPAS
jgi:hypothetical protein